MIFSVDKNQLSKHLSYTQGVVDSKSSMIILSHILFSAKQGRLFLSSTDLESSTHTSLPTNISEEGEVCLPAKKIFDIGFEKISLNTTALESPSLLSKVSDYFGSQAIIVSIDFTKLRSLKLYT